MTGFIFGICLLPCKTVLTVNDKMCLSLRAHGILAHVHVRTLLTTKEILALFVVNSVKLHLTASNNFVQKKTDNAPT